MLTRIVRASWSAQVIRLLRQGGASIALQDEDGQTSLHHAAAGGHIAAVQELAPDETCAELFVVDNYQMTPFHLACENGHAESVAHLLALCEKTEGEKLEQAAQMRRGSALFLAEKNGHEAVVGIVNESRRRAGSTATAAQQAAAGGQGAGGASGTASS